MEVAESPGVFTNHHGTTRIRADLSGFGFSNWGGGGKIEGRHISIIAMSEHHVDYMNRKGGHSVIMQGGGTFSPMCTSDIMDSCMAPGFWQTLISIAEVRKTHYSEIESYKSKPIDQNSQLFWLATQHSQ